MRFDLNQGDDDRELGAMADDANWPAGYVALGEQLRDDATFLADCYPAGAPPALLLALAQVLEDESSEATASAVAPAIPEATAPGKSGWSVAWNAILPSMLAAVALSAVAVIVVPQWYSQDNGAPVATPGKGESSAPRIATVMPVTKPIQSPEATPAPVDSLNPMTPALFEELSGPEREGLLDLLEHQPQVKPRLSI